jgi:hypothetical protein
VEAQVEVEDVRERIACNAADGPLAYRREHGVEQLAEERCACARCAV